MKHPSPIRVGVIGAGAISGIYLENMIHHFSILQVSSICANHLEHAQTKAAEFGIRACSFEEMLEDPSIDMIVNLTPVCSHYELIRKSLLAGKHVYTEKVIAETPQKAAELLQLSDEKNLFLGSAPDTFLGSSLQIARKVIDEGLLGEITSFAMAANRCNSYLLSKFPFLLLPGSGLCYDYAVYYLTALVSLLGPVAQTAAMIRAPYPTHVNILPDSHLFGQTMDTPNESQVYAILRLKNGISGTLHINADSNRHDQAFFAIYGTKGILYLCNPDRFGGTVRFLPNTFEAPDTQPAPVSGVFAYSENSRGVGPAEMAWAIRSGRKNRASKELAYHVLEVLTAMMDSSQKNEFIEIHSSCDRPKPLREHAASPEESLL